MERDDIRRILIAVNMMEEVYNLTCKKLGMKGSSLSLLYALDDGRPHSQKEISEQWLLPKTTLNSIVKTCEAAGYLELLSTGGKEKEIRLTPLGKELADRVLPQIYAVENRVGAEFPPELSEQFFLFAETLKAETLKTDFEKPHRPSSEGR